MSLCLLGVEFPRLFLVEGNRPVLKNNLRRNRRKVPPEVGGFLVAEDMISAGSPVARRAYVREPYLIPAPDQHKPGRCWSRPPAASPMHSPLEFRAELQELSTCSENAQNTVETLYDVVAASPVSSLALFPLIRVNISVTKTRSIISGDARSESSQTLKILQCLVIGWWLGDADSRTK